MKEYIIAKKNNIPWESIPELNVSEIMWLPDSGVRMIQQICYTSDVLLIHQRAIESLIRSEEHDTLSLICNDSCMEFFFDPCKDGRYFNFEINPDGFIYLGFGQERSTRLRLIEKNPRERFNIRTNRTDDGWEVYYTVPLAFIRMFYPQFEFKSGISIKANCYKCGDKTRFPHYLAWNPPESPTPDFHRPQDFGLMTFE